MFAHKLGTWKCPFNHSVLSLDTKYVLIGEHRGQPTRSAQSTYMYQRLHLALYLMHRMASISASMLNDEGEWYVPAMGQFTRNSGRRGVCEWGRGGGRKQKRIQREGQE